MSSIILNGNTLPGVLNVTGWGIGGSTTFNVLPRQYQVDGLQMKQESIDLTQSTAPQVGVSMQTYVVSEISTEETIQTLVNYCFKYVGMVGSLFAGSYLLANKAACTNVAPWFDHKKGYGILWSFILIENGNNTMNLYEKLKNPSFDALLGTVPAQWTLTADASGSCEKSQLFGVEEIGGGQFCIRTEKGTEESVYPTIVSSAMAKITGASADSMKNTYTKFSVQAVFQAESEEQTSTEVQLSIRGTLSTSTACASNYTIYSGRTEKLSIMVPSATIYADANYASLHFYIENRGVEGDVIFFDKCKATEVQL